MLQGGSPINLTASGVVGKLPGTLLGFYVNSTSSGTVVIGDAVTAANPVTGTITPAAGWNPCLMQMSTGCYATLGGTINVTFVYQQNA